MTKNAIEIIEELIAKLDLKCLHFVTFDEFKRLQDRISGIEIQGAIDDALKIREVYKLPFWDSLNLSLYDRQLNNYDFLRQIKFHNVKKSIIKIDAKNFHSFIREWDMDNYLTLNSLVLLRDGSEAQLSLLDFHIPPGEANAKLCENIVNALGQTGYLLLSGKSFHFYGDTILSQENFVKQLSTALLFCPIIDRTWIAHQLIEQSSCLRISKKYDHLPFLVKRME